MQNPRLKRYLQFFLVVLAAGAIYPLVYLRTNYQETILEVFDMTIQQMNTIYSVLGLVFVVGYLPSGLLSDKFSAKKLLAVSLAGTAVGGFWFAQVPQYTSVVLIFCIWGTFSVLTFWSSHLKLVKLLCRKEEEGRFFGILDGGRGVVEALLASVAVFIFSRILGPSLDIVDKQSALVAVIYMYSIALALTAVLIWFFVEDDKEKTAEQEESEKFRLSDLPGILKNKYLYLHGAIIFIGYSVFWTVYYIGGFLQTNAGVAPVTVGTVTVVILWMRPIGGFLGGYFADKAGKINTIITVLAGAAVCLTITAILPATTAHGVFFAVVILLGIFLYAIRGTYWSILGDDGFSNLVMGSAIGAISLIGYMPDIILPQFNSFLFNTFGGNGGYNAYFLSSAGFALIGIVFAIAYRRRHRKAQAVSKDVA
jgi:predicted MFS family arabinose efflux permease